MIGGVGGVQFNPGSFLDTLQLQVPCAGDGGEPWWPEQHEGGTDLKLTYGHANSFRVSCLQVGANGR